MASNLLLGVTITTGYINVAGLEPVDPSYANDDSLATSTQVTPGVYAAGEGYWYADLGTAYVVTSAELDISSGNPGGLSLYYSTTAGTVGPWTEIVTQADWSPTNIFTASFNVEARSWRLTFTNSVPGYAGSNLIQEWRLFGGTAEPAAPEPGYWIDWAGDGFDTGAGGTAVTEGPRLARGLPQAASVGTASGGDNVTPYVLASSWYRGGSYDHVGANGPGGFTILLDNSTGRFDPDNTASDLYGLMRPGLPVWAGAIAATGAVGTANGTGTVAGFIAGTVREFVPTVDASGRRVCEVIGEDAFGPYSEATVSVEPSLTRSHQAFRALILDGLGEDNARRDLAVENGTMPFSAVESNDGLNVLEELNRATATRHFIRPADSKEDWYDYVTVNKLHKLQAAADQTLDGDDITNVTGWRITNDNLIEVQRATVVPIGLTPDNGEVWSYEDVPFTMSAVRPKLIWANFDDYVFDASVDVDFTSGSGTANVTNYGKTAQVGIWATSANATIGRVRILGQQVTRGDSITVVAGDESPGKRAGSVISSDFIGQSGAAQGLVDFIVWKFGQPLKRPALTVAAKNAATLSTIFSRDLYDVMTLSIDKLSVTSRRVEIIGLRGSHNPGRSGDGIWSASYELQETPNQSALDWFDVDTDSINGAQVIAPF